MYVSKSIRVAVRLLTFTLAGLLMWAVASAQTNTGAIGGVVRDESEGVLPGATVIVTHEGTIQRVTDVDGR